MLTFFQGRGLPRSRRVKLEVRQDLRNSMYDGLLANMFATLTGGVFLTGFALYLGMNELMISLLAAIPFLVTVFQIPASYIIGRIDRRKALAYWAALVARVAWVPILLVVFLPAQTPVPKYLIVFGLFFLSHASASVSYVAWLSWTSDLVPEEMRGSFFGIRNMLCGLAGVAAIVTFGNLVDILNLHSQKAPFGFIVTFMAAVGFGLLSLRFLGRIPHIEAAAPERLKTFRMRMADPFREANFRRFLIFAFLWSFSVHFASPFFSLYFLRDLKYSYGLVATLGMLSALADMVGMRVWGRISDRVKNKVIIRAGCSVAAFLPLAWATVGPGNMVVPIILHIVGGGFWAGITLCMNNLSLTITPRQDRAVFLSTYNIAGGLGATLGPILGGLAVSLMNNLDLPFQSWGVVPIQIVFVASTLFRLASLQALKQIGEPEEVTVGQAVRILRSVRGLNMASGFNYLLHPFMEVSAKERDR